MGRSEPACNKVLTIGECSFQPRWACRSTRNVEDSMARFSRPAEGTWTQHYPELGTRPVSFEDSTSPAFFELERAAIFKRTWLNVGRVDQLPRNGSYFTKTLPGLRVSIIVTRD